MTNNLFLILFLFLIIFLGLLSEINLSHKIKKIFIITYCTLWNLFFLWSLNQNEYFPAQFIFENPFNLNISLISNFSLKNMITFSLICLFFMWNSINEKEKWHLNSFWIIFLVYITLFIDSYFLLLFCFEGFSWFYFIKMKPKSFIQNFIRFLHLVLGNFLILFIFMDISDNTQNILFPSNQLYLTNSNSYLKTYSSWFLPPLVFMRSLSFFHSLKKETINWIYLSYYLLSLALILKPFEENINLIKISFISAIIVCMVNILTSNDTKREFDDVYLITIFSTILLFFIKIISHNTLLLVWLWGFMIYYFSFIVKKDTFKIILLIFISLIPPSPLFFLVLEFIKNSPLNIVEKNWIQWIFVGFNLYSLRQISRYFKKKVLYR